MEKEGWESKRGASEPQQQPANRAAAPPAAAAAAAAEAATRGEEKERRKRKKGRKEDRATRPDDVWLWKPRVAATRGEEMRGDPSEPDHSSRIEKTQSSACFSIRAYL